MLTGAACYVADLRLVGMAHARFVRSTTACGRRVGVDTAEARARPGVLGVFTADDLGLADLKPIPAVNQQMVRPVLARDVVRFVGEPVAAVVAETAAAAADAVEHVVVHVEPAPAVLSLAEAAGGAVRVHEGADSNVAFDVAGAGVGSLDLSGCDVVVEASLEHQRLAAVPLEPRSAAAQWSVDGARLTFWASTQAPHRVRDALAALYGV